MSKISKKPAEIIPRKVSNIDLLPQIFNTEPNQKMLDSTVDLMTSKGQLLPFQSTYGIRSASNTNFLVTESDEIRRESQANNMLVIKNEDDEYLGKVSYLDIENYFKIKNLPLKDGVILDHEINVLSLPVSHLKIIDYHSYYWLPNDLPACRIHLEPKSETENKLSIQLEIIGRPFAKIISDPYPETDNDLTRILDLETGMVIYFTGAVDEEYKSVIEESPKLYFVFGVGTAIQLIPVTNVNYNIPLSYFTKRPWDKDDPYRDPPAVKWASENWDGSRVHIDPEYIVQDKYVTGNINSNHWHSLDHWYHISVIRSVASYLGINADQIANIENRAKRPIISFYRFIELYNWPKIKKGNVKTILYEDINFYSSKNSIVDKYGYQVENGDLIVFSRYPGVYSVEYRQNGTGFNLVYVAGEYDGVQIDAPTPIKNFQLILKHNKWIFAQNKIEKNQTPLFQFYTSNSKPLSDFTDTDFTGGIILGFKPGDTYDYVLDRNIDVSKIDFDLIDETNSSTVSPNRIKFITDVDKTFNYYLTDSGTELNINGPYGFGYLNRIFPFYNFRRGLDFTRQIQDLTYQPADFSEWEGEYTPIADGYTTLHIFYDTMDIFKFYYEIDGYGLIQVSSKISVNLYEQILPLMNGFENKIVCHNLPVSIALYKESIIDNISTPELLEEPYCFNNNINSGEIIIDLRESISVDGTNITNELALENSRLYWKFSDNFKMSVVRSPNYWRFLQSVYIKDKTNPIYNSYDYSVSLATDNLGAATGNNLIRLNSNTKKRIQNGDKIIINSIVTSPVSKTAPLSLTLNPFNESLSDINYYSLYQHMVDIKTNMSGIREIRDPDQLFSFAQMGGGTLIKHNIPLSKFAIMATNLPFSFDDILLKQAKHYDLFLIKLKTELINYSDSNDIKNTNWYEVLSTCLKKILPVGNEGTNFWYHSNMMGWGDKDDNYAEETIDSLFNIYAGLDDNFSPISHKAGKETLLHITCDNRILLRNVDYELISSDGYYLYIKFNSKYLTKKINIKQWFKSFNSKIPASLAKIGLSQCFMPEIYEDTSFISSIFYIIRHDGTVYYLEDGVDDDNYPLNPIDAMLFEYEKAVWSSISYDIETNPWQDLYKNQVGYFRTNHNSYASSRISYINELRQWMLENNVYVMPNIDYDEYDGFTLNYSLGSGDNETTVTGSWRAIYKYLYDTDRPHTHPWEMLGYSLKPNWWDNHYSWTDSEKRTKLEDALRNGNIAEPEFVETKIQFVRQSKFSYYEDFPIDSDGKLLPPNQLSWLTINESDSDWKIGDMGPYEYVFANTHRGLAAKIKSMYLLNPALYTNLNWVPGQIKRNEWKTWIDVDTGNYSTNQINHDYYGKEVDNDISYTSGIESLYAEFCNLYNIDFKTNVIDKFDKALVKKEFLLSGFTNKDNIRIKSTSINSRRQTLIVPDENFQVQTIKHFPHLEFYFSGLRVVYENSKYYLFGFSNELGYLPYYEPVSGSSTSAREIGDVIIKEKNYYDRNIIYKISYGTSFDNRQDLYDIIIGYGKLLEDSGFLFESAEGGDIRNWQLSAKQFIFWSNDVLSNGNYIDLNPCADEIIISGSGGHLENLEGTNQNIGHCVDRLGRPFFAKDLTVTRDNNKIIIKTKDSSRSVYGVKLTFSIYESVIHLDPVSIFDEVYFLPGQSTSKRSFSVAGKKTTGWLGNYFASGFIINNNTIIPNLDSMSDMGRTLLDIESNTVDATMLKASRNQFGLNKNPELRQLFLEEDKEILYKNAITYTKGTKNVFDSLNPITHSDGSKTVAYEEYMVRLGELGNTKNIEYYEFELKTKDVVKEDIIIKCITDIESAVNDKIYYLKDGSKDWVYRPYGKNLRFNTFTNTVSKLKTSGPILPGDTDFSVSELSDLPSLYNSLSTIHSIPAYDSEKFYKPREYIRFNGRVYISISTVSPNTWVNNSDKFTQVCEPFLPNVFIDNYYKPNDLLVDTGQTVYRPGTWQVMQMIDREVAIGEACPGPNDASRARITTTTDHDLKVDDWVMLVNTDDEFSTANGIWRVIELESGRTDQFYIDTRITSTIKNGKVFTFKPSRFKNILEFQAANYNWQHKICQPDISLPPLTPSGYDPTCPIAIIDDAYDNNEGVSYDYGNYKVICPLTMMIVKEESNSVDPSDIEHLLVYDYDKNNTVIKIDLFDPKKMIFPNVFQREIDVINRVDPARYNRSTDVNKSVYTSTGWYEEYVGRRWWDTSTLSFSDYENGDDISKLKYWGSTVDETLPDIYEWTKSNYSPSQYATLVENKVKINGVLITGEVFTDRISGVDQFHWCEETDYSNGKEITVYYFWVKNKQNIAEESKAARTYSVYQLSRVLLNPSAAGLAWWAPVSNNSLIIRGIKPYLTNSTVVQIKKKLGGEEKHQQWLFVSENNTVELIPEWLHIRFRDSIAAHIGYKIIGYFEDYSSGTVYKQGDFIRYQNKFYVCKVYMRTAEKDSGSNLIFDYDKWQLLVDVFELKGSLLGTWDGYFWDRRKWDDFDRLKLYWNKLKNVPDMVNLHPYNRYGNTIRPYIQSWFRNLFEARRTFILRLNEIMVHVNITSLSNWGNTILNNKNYKHVDGEVDMTKFWSYVDFKSETYSSLRPIVTVLDSATDLYSSPASAGDYIKVGRNITDYTIYEKNIDSSFRIVFKKNSAICFSKDLYETMEAWDAVIWDKTVTGWDYDINSVYNGIVDSLRYEIFLGNYLKYYSVIICTMFRYVLAEQINVDWLTKSSTVEPLNLVASEFTQRDILERDPITVIKNLYDSIKSYRDKLRGGTANKPHTEDTLIDILETTKLKFLNSDGSVESEITL